MSHPGGANVAKSTDKLDTGRRRVDRFNTLESSRKGKAAAGSKRRDRRAERKKPPSAPPRAGGGGRVAPPKPAGEDTSPAGALSTKLRDKAEALMDGTDGRFSDERVSMMKDQMFESTIGRVKKEVRAMDGGLVRRGMFRSGISARAEKDIRTDAMRNYSRGVKDIMLKKMDAEFEDKMRGMQMVQTWLSQKQNYDLGKERNVIAREQIAATSAASRLSAQVSREGIAASRANARAALADRASARGEARSWEASNSAYHE